MVDVGLCFELPQKIRIALLFGLVLVTGYTSGLTDDEFSQFHNDGSQGGTVTTSEDDNYYYVESNGLPDHTTQKVNSNTAGAQSFSFKFSKDLKFACTPSCLPGGYMGITKTGVALYNPLSSHDVNAVEGDDAEVFDKCNGHADKNSIYHYHQTPSGNNCGETYTGETDQFIGVALDGFPIYGPKVSDQEGLLTSDDLDVCHGRMVDGSYRYHMTYDFPYILGCYWGTQARLNSKQSSYACTDEGTDATEWGYLCSCTSWDPRKYVAATECSYLTESEGGVWVTTEKKRAVIIPTKRPNRTRPHFNRKSVESEKAYLRRWLEKVLRENK